MGLERIFIILILLTPLVIVPKMELGWEVGKIYWFWTIVEAWLWWRVITNRTKFVWNWPLVTMLIWLGAVLVSSVFAGGDAFWGGWWRRQGFWFMAHLGILFWLTTTTVVNSKYIQKAIIYIGTALLVVGTLAGGRWSGSILEPNNYAILAVSVFILSLDSKSLIPMLLSPVAIVLAGSRSPLLSGIVLVNYLPKKLLLAVSVFAFLFMIWFTWLRGGGGRWELWVQSLVLWAKHPWLGVGLDNFQSAFSILMQGKGLQWSSYDQPHNLILWLLVSTGSLGLATWVGWITTVLLATRNKLWIKIALAIIIFGLFQPLSISVWVYLFIALAISL